MKGVFLKLEKGWVIEYIDNHLERNFISLHPSDHITNKTQRVDGKEVEFEIVHLSTDPLGRDVKTYAKLVDKLGNEDVPKLGYDVWEAGLEDELNKLPYTKHLDDGQYNDGQLAGFELGATWGYNKAKETLYTDEQVREAYWIGVNRGNGVNVIPIDNFLQSIKQSKT